MHILIVAPEQIPVPPFRGGSVEICIMAIAKRLAVHHRVTIISRRSASYANKQTTGNLTIVRVPSGSPARYIASVLQYVRGKSYDWIQVDNRPRFVPILKAHFPHTPVSIYLHSLTFVSSSSAARCLAKADRIVGNSLSLKHELGRRFPSLRHKIKHVLLGVDLHQFRPPSELERVKLRERYGLKGSFIVAFAGRLIPRKGIPLLIQAISKVRKSVPQIKLVVAGNGNPAYKASLRKLAARLRVPTLFIGSVAHRKMHQVYWLADCFACPSQKHESFGLVNVEAMATGIPCIASRNGGIKEIIRHHRNGVLISDYRQSGAFAAQISKFAQNKAWVQKLGKQARIDMVHRFGWEATARSLIRLYKR